MLRVLLDLQLLQSASRNRGDGVVARGLADALLCRREIAWHVLLSDAMPETLPTALRWLRERIEADRIHVFHGLRSTRGLNETNALRARCAEALYTGFVEALAVDLVHVAGPFAGWDDETVAEFTPKCSGPAVATTICDLFAFEEPDLFLSTPAARNWHERRLADLTRIDTALVPSERTRQVVLSRTGLPESSVVEIGADVDPIFARRSLNADAAQALQQRYGISGPFLMVVGDTEPRSDIQRLIAAFAALPASARGDHQILLPGSVTEFRRRTIVAVVRSLGLPEQTVRIPSQLPNEDRAGLYNLATATIGLAADDGFGRSLIEAMRCGSPIVASDTGSNAATVGRSDFVFNAGSLPALTRMLERVLSDPDFRERARENGKQQQARFSWDASAERACAAFDAARFRRKVPRPVSPRPALDLTGLRPGCYQIPLLTDSATSGPAQMIPLVVGSDTQGGAIADGPMLVLQLDPPCGAHEPAGDYAHASDRPVDEVLSDAVATIRLRRGDPIAACSLAWHSWPRSFAATPSEESCADAAEGLRRVLDVHPTARAIETTARLRAILIDTSLSAPPLSVLAAALADNHAPARLRRRLLVDVTELARSDARSGIQRTVRNIFAALTRHPAGFTVLAIRRDGATYYYARTFTARLLKSSSLDADTSVGFEPGDTVLGLDVDLRMPPGAIAELQRQHLRGVRFVHVLYDVLPLRRPDWFGDEVADRYEHWLRMLSSLSDGIACISQAVADDLSEILAARKLLGERAPTLASFHLGADLDAATLDPRDLEDAKSDATAADDAETISTTLFDRDEPVFLSVGTIEPRKGYAQLLDAAELLWAKGTRLIVVIVGKRGWLVDPLIARIENHPERRERLYWFEAIDDRLLRQIYRGATVALFTSEGEGFGLPLIEAAHVGLPILARDLPVFREIAGPHATYFSGLDGASLAQAMQDWLQAMKLGSAPTSAQIKPLTWAESALQLLDIVKGVAHCP